MQIDDSKLESNRGRIIGIGRVKIPKRNDFNYEIPLLSFVVIEKNDGGYVSSCIHLQIDGYGQTDEDAQNDMIDNILYYLDVNFNDENYKDCCWANLLDLFEASESSSALWDKYHAFQVMLAEKGQASDQYSPLQLLRELLVKLEELGEKIRELETRVANLEDKRACKGSKFIASLKGEEKMLFIVQYIPVPRGVAL
jgi:hypothetical protein